VVEDSINNGHQVTMEFLSGVEMSREMASFASAKIINARRPVLQNHSTSVQRLFDKIKDIIDQEFGKGLLILQ
jgi:hypothetical protein